MSATPDLDAQVHAVWELISVGPIPAALLSWPHRFGAWWLIRKRLAVLDNGWLRASTVEEQLARQELEWHWRREVDS